MNPQNRLVVNIDNDRIARDSIRSYLTGTFEDIDVVDLDFSDALQKSDWANIDFVVLDLHEEHADINQDEFPACNIAHNIRSSGGPKPWIVIVTGATRAPRDPIVINRLIDAGADFLVKRREFADAADRLFGIGGPQYQPIAERAEAVIELGVPAGARIEALIRRARALEYGTKRLHGGSATRARQALTAAGDIAARSISAQNPGDPLHDEHRSASHEQLLRIIRRATREWPSQ